VRVGHGIALAALVASAACGDGIDASDVSRNAPPAADGRRDAVDGLIVGHRLMAAGEHELALKAYLRAAGEQGVDADTLSAIGSANLALGRLGQAEQILRRALELEPSFVPAMNNLGVALMNAGKEGEARVVFQQAYALDSGKTESIRENLRLAIARTENEVYPEAEDPAMFTLVRRAQGQYVLLSAL